MKKVRTLGPVMMVIVGLALVATPAQSAISVGYENPCDEAAVAIVDPCEPVYCNDDSTVKVAFVDPCSTPATRPEETTTTAEATTTTAAVTTTTAGREPTTTTVVSTTIVAPPTTAATTTAPAGVGGAGAGRPPSATQGGALARTGSNTAPLTAGGLALAGLGVVLLVAERRRAAAQA